MEGNIDYNFEERKVKNSVLNVITDNYGLGEIIKCENYSKLGRLLRVTSYVLRFIHNIRVGLKNNNDYKKECLTAHELQISKEFWVLYEQAFMKHDKDFEKKKTSLNLFYDERDVLRIKTRISGIEDFTFGRRFPVLLRNDSHFTKLVILNVHEEISHMGVSTTLNTIRNSYWIVRGRQTVKKVLKNCFICKTIQGKTIIPPQTPNLPNARVKCNHAFENVGIDFAGPLYCKENSVSGIAMSKCYILLITCSVTRAVHLELTPNVSTYSLILALKRFIYRRGSAKLIISDNFKSFKSVQLKEFLRNHDIRWQFILERSPMVGWILRTTLWCC